MGFQYSGSKSCLTLPYDNLDLPSQSASLCFPLPRIWVEMAPYSAVLVARAVSTLEVALLKLLL